MFQYSQSSGGGGGATGSPARPSAHPALAGGVLAQLDAQRWRRVKVATQDLVAGARRANPEAARSIAKVARINSGRTGAGLPR